MDKLIYTAMTAAKHSMHRQAVNAHNLANVNTAGFRAETSVFRAAQASGQGLPTRAYAVDSTPGADFKPGPIQTTDRDLDIAIQGAGWIAVQGPDGQEAYTRSGSLQIGEDSVLRTRTGFVVVGEGGPIPIPAETRVSIAADGTISAVPAGAGANNVTALGRIKLVNPAEKDLVRGADGLFRLSDGNTAEADPNVRIASGAVEGSNVNAVDVLVDMINFARQYELELKLMQSADNNARQATQLLSVNAQ